MTRVKLGRREKFLEAFPSLSGGRENRPKVSHFVAMKESA
jgi:hypothetical protein